jgi:hypothetical protein
MDLAKWKTPRPAAIHATARHIPMDCIETGAADKRRS